MKRLLLSLLTLAFAASVSGAAFAAAPNVKPSMSSMQSSTSCPAGETYVKAYTKSDGTKVAGYCRKASSSSMSTTCPKGESYVKAYTKADGTKVKGYCKKSSMKSTM